MNDEMIAGRKNDHLDIVLDPNRAGSTVSAGYAALTFEHCAVPELRLDDIDIRAELFGRRLAAPLLISSMTGGAARATQINRNLAEAAEALGIALGVGSQRIALETGADQGLTRQLRQLAPSIPLLANLGAAQLVAGYGLVIDPWTFAWGELVLLPVLIVLASLVGFVPGMTAYRTDVAQTLSD